MYDNYENVDRIAETFSGAKILMTGGSGFMGRIFVEKLLRLTKVEKIYLLLRGKRSKNARLRLMEIFDDCLFDGIKQSNTIDEILSRVELIEGDCSLPNLGISPINCDHLSKNITMIFHFAATIRFTEKFKHAVDLNVKGVRELLSLADTCEKLKLFCHISTAYSHLEEKIVMEKFYKVPFDPHEAIKMIEGKSEDEVEEIFSKFLCENIPNSYVFTKSLAESLIAESKLPILVCRPAIVTACYSDPFPGWICHAGGVTGCVVAGYSGLLRTMNCSGDNCLNLVPVDCSINDIFKATWDYFNGNSRTKIVNLSYQPMRLGNLTDYVVLSKANYEKTFWAPSMTFVTTKWIFMLRTFLFQWIPAFVMDFFMKVFGKKPMFMLAQSRISKELLALHPFINNDWVFSCENLKKINMQLNYVEEHRYESTGHDEGDYVRSFVLGARKYLLNEDEKSIDKARFRAMILENLDDFVKMAFFAYVFSLVIKFFSFIYRT